MARPDRQRGSGAQVTRHQKVARQMGQRAIFVRKRFQFATALIAGTLLPWLTRAVLFPASALHLAAGNALIANAVAVVIAFWTRLSIETYPGIRRSYVILPSALTGHGVVVAWFLLTRFPYDRVALALGFLLHVLWLYLLYMYAERRIRTRIAVVPFGAIDHLLAIDEVDWVKLKRPRLSDAKSCEAIVADFSADLPDEWEAFLADAALAGRIVYQRKQLAESLTGRVELEQLSENSFGSLVPARGYFHLKGLIDFLFALALLPFVLPLMLAIAIAIRVDSKGPVFFRQQRVGHAGHNITVYKFRTMRPVEIDDERDAAITKDEDGRVTRVGRLLRQLRLDELPQMFNILKWEMSWIGPRPEAEVLSAWYTSELPFYRYRHVVKPGISGWAQVNQGHVADVRAVHRKLQYDFYYIKYFSPWLDLLIFLRTVKTMLTGFGSK
ncbi:MAG TPA: sugar transferase [Sphingomicrobium sp.]|nr:sugar transferase [Sphingomicrobium sp.]